MENPTNKEIMGAIGELHEAVSAFADNVEGRFEKMESRTDSMESKMVTKDYFEDRLSTFEIKMVTKDYLDEKLFDLRGDLSTIIRKEDKKVESLVEILYKKKILTKEDRQEILKMEPFTKSV